MRLHYFLAILFISVTLFAKSQNISVKSFQSLQNDMDARVSHVKIDQNGEKCAIIKVVTTEQGFVWEGDVLGITSVEKKTGEYWLYVPHGAKKLTIKHNKLGVLRNYNYPEAIKEATVYEMQLTTGKVVTTIEDYEVPTQWVVITSEPEGADVYIDEQYVGTTPFTKKMKQGNHNYRLELGYYLTEAGKFELTEKERKDLNIILTPNFGYVTVSSSPEQGALVDLDGMPTNNVTPYTSQQLTPGKHKVTVKKVMYNPKTVEFNVVAGETKSLNVEMESNFATINITTTPEADIFIDDEYKGKGTYIGRLISGIHTLEARKNKHYSDKKQQEIIVGQAVNISLHPKAKTGNVDIVTTPFNVSIKLNGKEYGTAPTTIKDLLIGDYVLELEKEGYGTIIKNIIITENQTISINETLPTGKEITISSSPPGADLYIDGVKKGVTPLKLRLDFGIHKIEAKMKGISLVNNIDIVQEGKNSWLFQFSGEDFDWDKLQTSYSLEDYKSFLRKYPFSKYKKQVEEEIAYLRAKNEKNDIKLLEEYTYLYPQGKYISEINNILKISYISIADSYFTNKEYSFAKNTYKKYINKFPEGSKHNYATNKLKTIEKIQQERNQTYANSVKKINNKQKRKANQKNIFFLMYTYDSESPLGIAAGDLFKNDFSGYKNDFGGYFGLKCNAGIFQENMDGNFYITAGATYEIVYPVWLYLGGNLGYYDKRDEFKFSPEIGLNLNISNLFVLRYGIIYNQGIIHQLGIGFRIHMYPDTFRSKQ